MRSGPTPLERALDEHLRLALPGWGAPGGRFVDRPVRRPVGALSTTRVRVEAALRQEAPTTLHAILVADVAHKFRVPYSTAKRALLTVRNETRSLAA